MTAADGTTRKTDLIDAMMDAPAVTKRTISAIERLYHLRLLLGRVHRQLRERAGPLGLALP